MNTDMQKALLLAENTHSFLLFVLKCQEHHVAWGLSQDRLLQVHYWIKEYRFSVMADELQRINQYSYDGKYSQYLVGEVKKGLDIIHEYVKHHEHELYMLTGRIHTLMSICKLILSQAE